jgi:MFS family permease
VYLIFAYRVLRLSPGVIGAIFGAGAVGGLIGALSAAWIARHIGLGPTLFLTVVAGGVSAILIPLAQFGFAVPLLFVASVIGSFCNPVYNINQVSLRQTITPDRVQGRMNATVRTVIWGTMPIGALIGGVVGNMYGLLPAMYLGIVVWILSGFWILIGPVRLREQPQPA